MPQPRSETIQLSELSRGIREWRGDALDDVGAEVSQEGGDAAEDNDDAHDLAQTLVQLALRVIEDPRSHILLEELAVFRGPWLVKLEELDAAGVRPHELLELVDAERLVPLELLDHVRLEGLP